MKYQSVQKTNQLLQYEALVPRLKKSHPHYQKLKQQLGQDLSGYLGEKNVRYYFEFIQMKKGYHITGLRFKGSTFYTQIDHLIATLTAIFIIEAKNRKGYISQNKHGQYLQQYNQTTVAFDNPRIQVEIQKRQLSYVLKKHGFPTIPIIPLVAFSHNTVQLDQSITSPDVMIAQDVPFYINDSLSAQHQASFNNYELNQSNKLLTKLHEPLQTNIIEEYQINKADLIPGVICPTCKKTFTQRKFATWTCPICQKSDPLAHIQALREYALLFKPTINNSQARWWLNITNKDLSYRLISQFPLVKQVGKKAIHYDLSSLIDNPK